MRLTQINLAGFKSFVDPTQIPVPGQLVAIVGPNGCGKSNIIDAVRWVLGETSAKHLRGETMQDVLFNGSGERKPVNRASVELIFDNSLGKAAGQWSNYAEISVKRVLQREGDSSYYINNIHVRRRDIADIFLGTGLGARAYAIIEQGMISRVIEAKPEELRVFLEEAAGVSKYRERRRETELRLRDTRENLQRVDDIRDELTRQLDHLQGQAEVARQYHELQGALARTQNLHWYTKRQEAVSARNRHNREIERLGIELEAETARLREAERRIEEFRSDHFRAGDEVHNAQGALYETNSEVSRLEQQISHMRESRSRIEHQIATLQTQVEHSQSQLTTAEQNLEQWRLESEAASERAIACDEQLQIESEKVPVAEEAYRATSARREEVQRAAAQSQQQLQVEQTRVEHAARVLEQLEVRRVRLLEEQGGLPSIDEGSLEQIRGEVESLTGILEEQRQLLIDREAELPHLEARLREHTERRDGLAQRLAAVEARIDALKQIQDRLARGAAMEGWLSERGLSDAPRVWQGITIESGWEDALEAVLRERLNGITLDQVDQTASWLREPPPGKITVVDVQPDAPGSENHGSEGNGLDPLQKYVFCRDLRLAAVLAEWLHDVYVVADSGLAMACRSQLAAGAMLVTPGGQVFTRHSVSFYAPDTELHGVLSRQREIESLEQGMDAAQKELLDCDYAVAAAAATIGSHRTELSATREAITQTQQRQHAQQMEMLRLSEQQQRLTERGQQIASELDELQSQTGSEAAQRETAAAEVERLQSQIGEQDEQLQMVNEHYTRSQEVLNTQRESMQQAQREHQEVQFHLRNSETKITEITQSINALRANVESLASSVAAEQEALAGCDEKDWQDQLQQLLEVKSQREETLAQARDRLEELETSLRTIEQERLASEQKITPTRERINDVRLKEQEARLTEEQYAQNLAESGANEEELAQLLEKGTRSGALQSEINRLNEAIRELGAVNLAALDELKASEERKTYLDAQSADLLEAMQTLEDAIKRIDRETRDRLQQTFDQVNEHFSKMFPTLFGGGNAKLVMTGEEILDCGVQVIAQPPGKKNTSIHLLSGGEKALTAMSLVFSIFQINPAPFCLLDEVDAPLDDSNTERFCNLVKQMSATSQFMFISHNKITMEIANQLLGITMQEPGVSRVVAVDIEEAMKLTEKAA